jgi:VWFA-related protein
MRRRSFLIATLVAPLWRVRGQQVIRAESRLVIVPVTVMDDKHNYVTDLGEDDFELLDDDTPRRIHVDVAGTAVAPISLVIAVQTCAISAAALAKARAIGSTIQPLITGDRGEAAVIAFDDQIHPIQDFTSDGGLLIDAFDSLRAGSSEKQGRMLDAVAQAATMLAGRRPDGRRVLLLISESKDRGSKTKLDAAVRMVQQQGITVYAATYSAIGTAFASKPEDAPALNSQSNNLDYLAILGELARKAQKNSARFLTVGTGGADFGFLKKSGLERAITDTGIDLHSQYILSFTPPNDAEPGMHRIEVRVKRGGRYLVRARAAYQAGT